MSWLAGLGAVAKAAAAALGLVEKRQEQLDRQEYKQDGARNQQLQDTKAENEDLRDDLEIYARPDTVQDAADALRRRAAERERLRGSGGDKPD